MSIVSSPQIYKTEGEATTMRCTSTCVPATWPGSVKHVQSGLEREAARNPQG